MTTQQPPVKSFIKEGNEAVVVCPDCAFAATICIEKFRNRKHKFKVKCKCTKSFDLQLEFRQGHRKETDLEGSFKFVSGRTGNGRLRIVDLSLRGVCFKVRGEHDLQVGHTGKVKFTLDNRKQTFMERNVTVKWVTGNRIGCEFADDTAYETELGFYVRP